MGVHTFSGHAVGVLKKKLVSLLAFVQEIYEYVERNGTVAYILCRCYRWH